MARRRKEFHEVDSKDDYFVILEAAALEYPCPRCEAEPGDWCETASGRRATFLHSAREAVIRHAMSLAYQMAMRETEEMYEAGRAARLT